MDLTQIAFLTFAAVTVAAAVAVISVRNTVHAALFLVLTFFSAAGLWMLLEAEFLAITLVLVYVVAVMVLFLFVVMMLDINLVRLREGFGEYLPIGALVAVLLAAEMGLILATGYGERMAPLAHGADYSNTRELGRILYTVYMYPFEIAGAILLTAIVAAIALTLRHRPETKYQDAARQVRVRREDRVRLVKMPAEKKS